MECDAREAAFDCKENVPGVKQRADDVDPAALTRNVKGRHPEAVQCSKPDHIWLQHVLNRGEVVRDDRAVQRRSLVVAELRRLFRAVGSASR